MINGKKTIRIISLVVVLSLTLTFSVFASAKGNKMKPEKNNFYGNFNKATEFIRGNKIIKGDGNGNYNWDNYVKRGDITLMIVRSFKLSTIIKDNFNDVEPGSYYYEAIATVKSHGIAKGDGKNFNPKKYVTIQEAIALIERSVAVANSNVILNNDVDLNDIYSSDILSNYATREDVANMLYYVLTGDKYDEDKDTIEYTIKKDAIITFDEDDFEDVFEDATDEELSYVKFMLPLNSCGKLYYDYTSRSKYDSLVNARTEYYINSNPNVSKVTFVPNVNYDGKTYIKYIAYDEDDNSYEGIIKIVIEENDLDIDKITYTVEEGNEIIFDKDDFEDVFEDATDEELSYVKFILPLDSCGKLYYDYTSRSKYDSLVNARTKYYVNSNPNISKVTFVPNVNYHGKTYIKYIAYDEDDNSYTGEIKIIIKED